MELTKTNNGQWKPGQSGNQQGRPVGSRNQFSNAFMQDLAGVWAEHGRETMVATAKVNPEAFFATCARLLPRDVAISIQAQTPVLDGGDLAILRAIKEAIPDANNRSPENVLTFVLEAIRSHSAQLIDARDNETRGQSD
jgi:Family of unknown function (DUF5681)